MEFGLFRMHYGHKSIDFDFSYKRERNLQGILNYFINRVFTSDVSVFSLFSSGVLGFVDGL